LANGRPRRTSITPMLRLLKGITISIIQTNSTWFSHFPLLRIRFKQVLSLILHI
jgi:hypothetical protein